MLWWADVVWSGASWGRLVLASVVTLIAAALVVRRFFWTQLVRVLARRRAQRR